VSRPARTPARDLLLSPVEPAGAVEQVVRRIGEAIGAGLLAPGERLPGQIELAGTLGVARMTLRQALAVLEDAGLIEIRRTAREPDALEVATAAVEAATGDAAAFRRADARFHVLVAELARSQRLVAAEAQLQVELGEVLAITPGPARARRVSQAGHGPIVAAIAAGDPDAARAAMIRHAEATHDWVRGLARGAR
jgi:GntR family transcriptional repressor for pyruvate dehydrogenase complex